MASCLVSRGNVIGFPIRKFNNLVLAQRIRSDVSYKSYSSLSCASNSKLPKCQPHPRLLGFLTQNKLTISSAPFHTSRNNCEIFNIQDEDDFKKRVLDSKKAIIVDFHAKWCGPCKILMPRLETAIMALKGSVDLAKVDIDDHPDIAMDYNVGAVPSVLAIKNGSVVDKFVGLKDDDQIGTFIASATKK